MPTLTNPPKRGAYFKLSIHTLAQLDELAQRHGSKAEVVTLAIDRMYQVERPHPNLRRIYKIRVDPDNTIVFFYNGGAIRLYELNAKRRATLEKLSGYYCFTDIGGGEGVIPPRKEAIKNE